MDAPRSFDRPAPLIVPAEARTVLLFGGTFDPPHMAHTALAISAALRVDPNAWLVFVPAAQSPLKSEGPVASDHDRVRMLELALRGSARTCVWSEELQRPGPSYSIDTVRAARAVLPPGTDVRLLIGSDQAAAFHLWRDARQLASTTRPVVLLREPHLTRDDLAQTMRAATFWSPQELVDWLSRVDPGERLPSSATDIRRRLAAGATDSELARELHPAVLKYIREHGLYR